MKLLKSFGNMKYAIGVIIYFNDMLISTIKLRHTVYNTNTKRYGNDGYFVPIFFCSSSSVNTIHLYSLNKQYHVKFEIYIENNWVVEKKLFLEQGEHLLSNELNNELIFINDGGSRPSTLKNFKRKCVAMELKFVKTHTLISSIWIDYKN